MSVAVRAVKAFQGLLRRGDRRDAMVNWTTGHVYDSTNYPRLRPVGAGLGHHLWPDVARIDAQPPYKAPLKAVVRTPDPALPARTGRNDYSLPLLMARR